MASGNDTPDPNKPGQTKRSVSAAALGKTNGKKPPKVATPADKPKKK
jgi:hypothetical protein